MSGSIFYLAKKHKGKMYTEEEIKLVFSDLVTYNHEEQILTIPVKTQIFEESAYLIEFIQAN